MPETPHPEHAAIESAVRQWLTQVIIGLDLCPFAGRPARRELVRFAVSTARNRKALLADLEAELERLHITPAEELETTLLIVPDMLADFLDYNEFLDQVDVLLARSDWQEDFQVASFHPHYQFAGTAPEDAGNLTNRAPYPILHILREASVEQALIHNADADLIPETNIQRMNQLSDADKQRLFPYLFPVESI